MLSPVKLKRRSADARKAYLEGYKAGFKQGVEKVINASTEVRRNIHNHIPFDDVITHEDETR